jgi:hypothetical protein
MCSSTPFAGKVFNVVCPNHQQLLALIEEYPSNFPLTLKSLLPCPVKEVTQLIVAIKNVRGK